MILFLSMLSLVAAHGWLVQPAPRGTPGQAGASKAAPCGEAGTTVGATDVGETLDVYWDIGADHNGGGGAKSVRFALSFGDATMADFDANVVKTVNDKTKDAPGTDKTNKPYGTTLDFTKAKIPSGGGRATLQMYWIPGDNSPWFSCALIDFKAPGSHINKVAGADDCLGGLVKCRESDNGAGSTTSAPLLLALAALVLHLLIAA